MWLYIESSIYSTYLCIMYVKIMQFSLTRWPSTWFSLVRLSESETERESDCAGEKERERESERQRRSSGRGECRKKEVWQKLKATQYRLYIPNECLLHNPHAGCTHTHTNSYTHTHSHAHIIMCMCVWFYNMKLKFAAWKRNLQHAENWTKAEVCERERDREREGEWDRRGQACCS